MLNFFPFLFVFFWSSAFVSGQIIVQSASPFASLSFRFLIVAFGFIIFAKIFNEKILVKNVLFELAKVLKKIYPTADVDYPDYTLKKATNKNLKLVKFGNNVLVGKNVKIDKNTFIGSNTII